MAAAAHRRSAHRSAPCHGIRRRRGDGADDDGGRARALGAGRGDGHCRGRGVAVAGARVPAAPTDSLRHTRGAGRPLDHARRLRHGDPHDLVRRPASGVLGRKGRRGCALPQGDGWGAGPGASRDCGRLPAFLFARWTDGSLFREREVEESSARWRQSAGSGGRPRDRAGRDLGRGWNHRLRWRVRARAFSGLGERWSGRGADDVGRAAERAQSQQPDISSGSSRASLQCRGRWACFRRRTHHVSFARDPRA